MDIDSWTPLLSEQSEQSGQTGQKLGSRLIIHARQDMGGEPLELESMRESPEIIYGQTLENHVHDPLSNARTAFFTQDNDGCFGLDDEQYSMHLLLLGGIGSGKTNVFKEIVRSLRSGMDENDILIIFDSKGDFIRQDHLYRQGDIVIGNSAEYKDRGWRWNIYGEIIGRMPVNDHAYPYEKIWEQNAKEMIKAFFKDRRSSTQPFFADAAADLITMKLIHDLRHPDPSQLHTFKLKEFFKQATVAQYDEMVRQESDFRSAKMYYGDGTTPQALGVFAYINSFISDCFCGVFGDSMAGREFSMRDLVRGKGGKAVFVEYDMSLGEVFAPNYSMLYDQALKEALGRDSAEKGRVYLICDEFKLLGKLDHIDDGLNFGRSLGVAICAGLQSVNQIYDLYGEEKGKVILSGFSNMFCFRTGDAETRKFISEHFGSNYSQIPFWKNATEKSYLQRDGKVVEDWDILRLQRGEAIVGLWTPKGRGPFKFQFREYE